MCQKIPCDNYIHLPFLGTCPATVESTVIVLKPKHTTDQRNQWELWHFYADIFFLQCSEFVWEFWLRAIGNHKLKACLYWCTMSDFKCNRFEELLAGQLAYVTNKLIINWKLKLSSHTSFDFNPASLLFWQCPFWDMQLNTTPLPFKSLSTGSSNGEFCHSIGFKTCIDSSYWSSVRKRNIERITTQLRTISIGIGRRGRSEFIAFRQSSTSSELTGFNFILGDVNL